MDRYDPDAHCPKCGSDRLTSNYEPETDVMSRRCSRCGHEFDQKPIDAHADEETDRP